MENVQTVPSYQAQQTALVEQLKAFVPPEMLDVFTRDAEAMAQRHASPLRVKAGDPAPLFELPNAIGRSVRLDALLKSGPVVLTFYRGIWCPYCALELRNFQQILPQIEAVGAKLVAISPMTPDHSLTLQEREKLAFEVLSDAGNQVARQYTTVFRQGEQPTQAQAQLGINFSSFYGDDTGELPVPATFVIGSDGRIRFAGSEGGDYRKRLEPAAILAALDKL